MAQSCQIVPDLTRASLNRYIITTGASCLICPFLFPGARSLIYRFPGSFSQNCAKVMELCTGTEHPKKSRGSSLKNIDLLELDRKCAAFPGARSLICRFPGSFSQNCVKVVELCTGTEHPKKSWGSSLKKIDLLELNRKSVFFTGARSLICRFLGSFSQNCVKVVELCTGTVNTLKSPGALHLRRSIYWSLIVNASFFLELGA